MSSIRESENKKPVVIIIAAIFYMISGALISLTGFLLIVLNLELYNKYLLIDAPYFFGSVFGALIALGGPITGPFWTITVKIIGIINFMEGILFIYLGNGLWKMKKWAGVLGIFLRGSYLLFFLLFFVVNSVQITTGIAPLALIVNVMVVVLIMLGWKSLGRNNVRPTI